MASRRKARVLAVQALYAWDLNPRRLEDLLRFEWLRDNEGAQAFVDAADHARLLIGGVLENVEQIDELLQDHMAHWKMDRVNKVDLAILRLGVYELRYTSDVPREVVLDESVGIARDLSGDDSFRFVNGILDSISEHAGGSSR